MPNRWDQQPVKPEDRLSYAQLVGEEEETYPSPAFVQLTDSTWVAVDHITKMEQIGDDVYVYLTRSDTVAVRNSSVPYIISRIRDA